MSFADYREKVKASNKGRAVPAPPFAPGDDVTAAVATGTVDRLDPGPVCRDCPAFHADGHSRETGECRRYAPRPGVAENFAWPMVDGDDWCVQHRSIVPPFHLTFVEGPAPVDPKAADDD